MGRPRSNDDFNRVIKPKSIFDPRELLYRIDPRATIHFDAVTSNYINLGPTEPLELRNQQLLPEASSNGNESLEEPDLAKLSAEKIRQVKLSRSL